MQSDWKIRKLRAELEKAEQFKKDESTNAAKEQEEKEKDMGDKAAKDKGEGVAGEVEEEGGRRSQPTGEIRDHPEESDEEISGESAMFASRNRRKPTAQKRAFEREVQREVERRLRD